MLLKTLQSQKFLLAGGSAIGRGSVMHPGGLMLRAPMMSQYPSLNPQLFACQTQSIFRPLQAASFSQFFRDLDHDALKEFGKSFCGSKQYKKAVNLWKVPMENKRLKRERKAANPPFIQPPEESGVGLTVIHDPARGVSWPPSPDECFAIVDIKGQQHKVCKDDRLILENLAPSSRVTGPADLPLSAGQQLIFEDVLMFATADLTVLGKPKLARARVYASIEEMTLSEKVIIFKKNRRQGYQKSQGHKQKLTVVKIDKVEYDVTEEELVSGIGSTTIALQDQ